MLHALSHLPLNSVSSASAFDSLTPYLTGPTAMLFSQSPPDAILPILEAFSPLAYARAGQPASRTFTLPTGRLYSLGGQIPVEDDVPVTVQQEVNLRKLGLPTRVEKGKVFLENEFEVCKEGDVLGSAQTSVLKAFGVQMAEFRVRCRVWWEKETGRVKVEDGMRDGDVEKRRGNEGIRDGQRNGVEEMED